MITIRQQGRLCHIESKIDDKLNNVISKKLSYMKQSARFLPNPLFGLVNLYSKKRQVFPLGLLSQVELILKEWKKQYGDDYEIIFTDKHNIVIPIALDPTLRDYQKEAIMAVINNRGGIISLPTSAGKTRIAIEILKHQTGKKLILVPTKDLVSQWKVQIKGVDVDTYAMLYRHLDRLNAYDWIVADECHHIAAKTLYKVGMHCENAIMIGLSATVKRDDGESMKMHAVLGDIVYNIPIQKLVEQGYLLPAEVYILPVNDTEVSPFDEYRDLYKNHIVLNEQRNELVVNTAIEQCKEGTCIIMVEQIEHGTLLFDMIQKCNTTKLKVVFVNGQSDDRDMIFKKAVNDKYNIIIATKVYGEGVSISCLKSMIIAGGGKGITKSIQQVGRLLRHHQGKTRAIIFDFDDQVKILKRHAARRIKTYEQCGFEVIYKEEKNEKRINK